MISHKNKFILICPPKTASVSIISALRPYLDYDEMVPQHGDCYDVNDEFGEMTKHIMISQVISKLENSGKDHSEYVKIGLIRNPYARIVSRWKFDNRYFEKEESKTYDFKTYLKKRVQQDEWRDSKYHDGWMPGAQLVDYFEYEGKMLVDNFIRLESIQEDFDKVCDLVNIPRITLPFKNKSNYKSHDVKKYREFYDDESRAIVEKVFARDIEYFDYEF